MQLALGLARRRLGQSAPNPAVGALIVDEATGELIARGSTQPGGRPHAEAHVLQRAGGRARGKTMYVTLEPCSHHGKTPPCVDAILAAGVARVVCAIEDPDPRVSGRGVALLSASGVRVDVGLAAACARWMAAGHFLRMHRRRPPSSGHTRRPSRRRHARRWRRAAQHPVPTPAGRDPRSRTRRGRRRRREWRRHRGASCRDGSRARA